MFLHWWFWYYFRWFLSSSFFHYAFFSIFSSLRRFSFDIMFYYMAAIIDAIISLITPLFSLLIADYVAAFRYYFLRFSPMLSAALFSSSLIIFFLIMFHVDYWLFHCRRFIDAAMLIFSFAFFSLISFRCHAAIISSLIFSLSYFFLSLRHYVIFFLSFSSMLSLFISFISLFFSRHIQLLPHAARWWCRCWWCHDWYWCWCCFRLLIDFHALLIFIIDFRLRLFSFFADIFASFRFLHFRYFSFLFRFAFSIDITPLSFRCFLRFRWLLFSFSPLLPLFFRFDWFSSPCFHTTALIFMPATSLLIAALMIAFDFRCFLRCLRWCHYFHFRWLFAWLMPLLPIVFAFFAAAFFHFFTFIAFDSFSSFFIITPLRAMLSLLSAIFRHAATFILFSLSFARRFFSPFFIIFAMLSFWYFDYSLISFFSQPFRWFSSLRQLFSFSLSFLSFRFLSRAIISIIDAIIRCFSFLSPLLIIFFIFFISFLSWCFHWFSFFAFITLSFLRLRWLLIFSFSLHWFSFWYFRHISFAAIIFAFFFRFSLFFFFFSSSYFRCFSPEAFRFAFIDYLPGTHVIIVTLTALFASTISLFAAFFFYAATCFDFVFADFSLLMLRCFLSFIFRFYCWLLLSFSLLIISLLPLPMPLFSLSIFYASLIISFAAMLMLMMLHYDADYYADAFHCRLFIRHADYWLLMLSLLMPRCHARLLMLFSLIFSFLSIFRRFDFRFLFFLSFLRFLSMILPYAATWLLICRHYHCRMHSQPPLLMPFRFAIIGFALIRHTPDTPRLLIRHTLSPWCHATARMLFTRYAADIFIISPPCRFAAISLLPFSPLLRAWCCRCCCCWLRWLMIFFADYLMLSLRWFSAFMPCWYFIDFHAALIITLPWYVCRHVVAHCCHAITTYAAANIRRCLMPLDMLFHWWVTHSVVATRHRYACVMPSPCDMRIVTARCRHTRRFRYMLIISFFRYFDAIADIFFDYWYAFRLIAAERYFFADGDCCWCYASHYAPLLPLITLSLRFLRYFRHWCCCHYMLILRRWYFLFTAAAAIFAIAATPALSFMLFLRHYAFAIWFLFHWHCRLLMFSLADFHAIFMLSLFSFAMLSLPWCFSPFSLYHAFAFAYATIIAMLIIFFHISLILLLPLMLSLSMLFSLICHVTLLREYGCRPPLPHYAYFRDAASYAMSLSPIHVIFHYFAIKIRFFADDYSHCSITPLRHVAAFHYADYADCFTLSFRCCRRCHAIIDTLSYWLFYAIRQLPLIFFSLRFLFIFWCFLSFFDFH